VRAYCVPPTRKDDDKRRDHNKKGGALWGPSPLSLTLDIETTTGAEQRPRVGNYQVHRDGELIEEGLFYDPDALSTRERRRLRDYVRRHNLVLRTIEDFDEQIIYRLAYRPLASTAPWLEDYGVAALEAEDGAVDGDVGPRLVDNADHPNGHAHPADGEAIGPRGVVEFFAHGVGQGRHLADALGEVSQAGGIQREAVDLCGGETVGLGRGEVALIGRKDSFGRHRQQRGQLDERGVLRRGRRGGEHERRGAGALGDRGDELGEIGGHGGLRNHEIREKHERKESGGRNPPDS